MEYDATTGQYYDHARDYRSSIGRFSGIDPIGFRGGDSDLYRYVTNSPTDIVDLTGLSEEQNQGEQEQQQSQQQETRDSLVQQLEALNQAQKTRFAQLKARIVMMALAGRDQEAELLSTQAQALEQGIKMLANIRANWPCIPSRKNPLLTAFRQYEGQLLDSVKEQEENLAVLTSEITAQLKQKGIKAVQEETFRETAWFILQTNAYIQMTKRNIEQIREVGTRAIEAQVGQRSEQQPGQESAGASKTLPAG